VATVNGQIFVVGGLFDGVVQNSVEARRTRGDARWRQVAVMPTGRADLAVGVVGGIVYAAGGLVEGAGGAAIAVDVVERYDLRNDSWTTGIPMPVPRAIPSAAGLSGRLYVAGGVLDDNDPEEHATTSVLAFDPREGRWASVAPMLTPRARFRLVAASGHLFAIGGLATANDPLSSVERYSPQSNSWEMVSPMHSNRALPGVAVLTDGPGERIVVVGGGSSVVGDPLGRLSSTEVYHVRSDRWQLLDTQLPHGTAALVSALESDNAVLAIGGSHVINGVASVVPDVLALKIPHYAHDSDG